MQLVYQRGNPRKHRQKSGDVRRRRPLQGALVHGYRGVGGEGRLWETNSGGHVAEGPACVERELEYLYPSPIERVRAAPGDQGGVSSPPPRSPGLGHLKGLWDAGREATTAVQGSGGDKEPCHLAGPRRSCVTLGH